MISIETEETHVVVFGAFLNFRLVKSRNRSCDPLTIEKKVFWTPNPLLTMFSIKVKLFSFWLLEPQPSPFRFAACLVVWSCSSINRLRVFVSNSLCFSLIFILDCEPFLETFLFTKHNIVLLRVGHSYGAKQNPCFLYF